MAHTYFMVVRQDDNGCRYAVADKLDQREACLLADRLAAQGHKQAFFVHNWSTLQERESCLQGN